MARYQERLYLYIADLNGFAVCKQMISVLDRDGVFEPERSNLFTMIRVRKVVLLDLSQVDVSRRVRSTDRSAQYPYRAGRSRVFFHKNLSFRVTSQRLFQFSSMILLYSQALSLMMRFPVVKST